MGAHKVSLDVPDIPDCMMPAGPRGFGWLLMEGGEAVKCGGEGGGGGPGWPDFSPTPTPTPIAASVLDPSPYYNTVTSLLSY